jgi:predicted amidohydrolase
MSLDKRQNFQHNTRAIRQAMQNLMQLGVGPELARLALSNIEDPDPETALEWIRDNQD